MHVQAPFAPISNEVSTFVYFITFSSILKITHLRLSQSELNANITDENG